MALIGARIRERNIERQRERETDKKRERERERESEREREREHNFVHRQVLERHRPISEDVSVCVCTRLGGSGCKGAYLTKKSLSQLGVPF